MSGRNVRAVDIEAIRGDAALLEIADTGSLEALEIETLKFDHQYQREIGLDSVQAMSDQWDKKVAGVIVCNRRKNGDVFVIDGQHRVAAAKMAGETHILCLVFEELSPQQEALMRIKGNVRKPDNAQDRFRAAIAAGDPEARAIQEICKEFGTQINFTPDPSKGINAVSTIEAIYRRDNGMLLSRVFDVIVRAWGQIGGPTARTAVFRGLAWLLDNHRDKLDTAHLVDRLQGEGSDGLWRKAQSHKAAWQGSMWANWYRAVVEIYNVKLPESRRLQFQLRGQAGRAGGINRYGESAG